ncbi:MAG: hypothetical protein AB7S75_12005 [Desulfococcaceae bacterium]
MTVAVESDSQNMHLQQIGNFPDECKDTEKNYLQFTDGFGNGIFILGDLHEKMYHHCRVGTVFCARRPAETVGTKNRAHPTKNGIIINGNHLKKSPKETALSLT